MDNINGALAFKATLDINDFNVSAQAMERSIKQVSSTAVSESSVMDNSIQSFAQNGAKYIVSYLVGQGMGTLLQSIVQTRGQFQQLEIAFTTMLKSGTQAKGLMDRLIDTAAKTPFDLSGIASSAKQMLAYGSTVDNVVDELVMLGNVASGVGAPLQDIAYLYGTLRTQGRAFTVDIRQFAGRGIPIYEELAKVLGVTKDEVSNLVTEGKVGFAEVEKAFQNMTGKAGTYYNLMQEQSKSLTGMISNMGDAWEQSLNKLGADNQDVFAGAIESATYMAEHLDDILRILKAVAIGYGSVKAAIVLNTLATKGYTGVALLDNTARQAKISLMKLEAVATGQMVAQTKAMVAAQNSHVAALQAQLTVEEHANMVKQLRIATIQQMLTIQQAEYLSNLNLTASSANYEAVALSVLTVEQKQALSKLDLSAKSAVYRAALENEVAVKTQNSAATLNAMRTDVKAAAVKMESARADALAAKAAVERAYLEVYRAQQTGNAEKIAIATKKMEAAQDNQSAARKAALAAQTDLYTKRKQLEAAAIQQSRIASSVDTAAKAAQATTTNVLTLATSKLTASFKALWLSMKANPITWVVSLVGMAFSAISMLSSKTKELEEDTVSLTNSTKRATERFSEEAGKVEALEKIIRNSNVAYDERNKALNELKQIIPGYNAELTKEGTIINDNADAIQRYLSLLEKQIRMKAAQEELEAAYREKRLKEKEIIQKQAAYDEASANVPDVAYGDAGAQYQMYALRQAGKAERQLKQAQKELTDINKTIEALNQEISDTSGEIDKSSESAKTYSEQIADTRTQIATLTKELEDLRSGKVVKDNLAGEIDAKIKELNTAKKNLELLTGITSSGNSSNSANQLSQKELEAQRELEEARISIMEDGYEKRKAILDLQHKENLDRIDREERELEKARKAAGKGGLTATEQAGFDERRSIENTSYQREQNKLFDGEIAYKKQQYELYFRWVRNLGEDVANTQFANLLKGGASFKQYLENQMAEMNQKKEAGTLTEGESNQLISLNMQYNEITGAKSAMDSFKESVSKTIQQAQTLAEKLEAIADAKEKLANGSSGLVGADEKAEATLFVSEEDEKLQEEVQQKILSSYRTFEEQRNDIQKEYALLRAAAQKTGDQERINQVNKSEAEALSTLTANMLKQSDSWKKLFGDLDSLSVAEIDKLVADIETKLKDADLKLNPVDYRALIDSLNQAKETLISKNPFKALGTFYDDYIEAKKKLAEAKANVAAGKGTDEDVKKAEADMKKAAKGVTKSIETITDTATTCGNAIASMFSDLGQDDLANGLGTAMELFGQLGNAAASVGKMMSGDILGGVTGMVSAVTSVVGIFAKLHDSKYEKKIQNLQKEIDALEQSYSRLERAYNNTYWVFNDSQREAYEKNIQLINDQIRALEQEANVAKKNWDFARYAQLNKEIKELNKQLKNAEENGDMFSIYEAQKKNLKQQQEDLRKQIQAEKDKKKTDNGKIQQWNEQIESITQQIEDLDRSMMETLAGTDVKTAIDEFADALVDAYCKGEDAAEALGEKTKEVLKKAVVEALKREFLAKGINDAVLYLGESMKDGKLTDVEKREFERMVNAAGDLFNSALEGIGDWIKDVEEETVQQDPLTGAVTSMNEETGGVIAGRLNAFVINQSDQTSIMRQALVYQAEIAANTKLSASELTEIKTTLKRIENKDSSLLSQGIA